MGIDDHSKEDRLARLEDQLAKKGITVRSRNDDVIVVVNGHGKLVSVEIDPKAVRNIRTSKLEITVTETIKSARAKAVQLRELALRRLEG
ncbi:YbaB/EbfC family nucleoid-associated protein [Actinoallomurus soli]|uniref:YbaB/EbfC family nucleoid-associated protein n=1 Tax=Actinoallomurus soli TaxID=2952535 RepID=UPI0020922711|nr:YbaB/EbfC family nucleoid-associated protein [Actinoallomurus soli]MCO5966920.1 YbaB/EbfC family nucleoid-associated protein [Actinoallomurus soli]